MFFESNTKSPWGYQETYHRKELAKLQQAAKHFETAILSGELPVPSYYDIFMFQCLRSKTFVSTADYEFWKDRGWLDSRYFYDVKLSLTKELFARGMRWYIDMAAKKILAGREH